RDALRGGGRGRGRGGAGTAGGWGDRRGCLGGAADGRDEGGSPALCPRRLCGRGVAYRRSGVEGGYARLSLPLRYLGTERGRRGRTRRRLAQPAGCQRGQSMKAALRQQRRALL